MDKAAIAQLLVDDIVSLAWPTGGNKSMSLQDVMSHIEFDHHMSTADVNTIKTIIANIYSSDEGKALLDKIPTHPFLSLVPLYFKETNLNTYTNITQGEIYYNWDTISDVLMIDPATSTTHAISATRMILHEMIHAINEVGDVTSDDFVTPGTDYYGSVVPLENTIMTELGEAFGRAGYYAVLTDEELAQLDLQAGDPIGGFQAPIDFAIVDSPALNEMDTSDKNTDVMLIGLSGDDTLTSGGGFDVIYGGNGNDTINGGESDDYLFGNADNDLLKGGEGLDELYGGAGADILIGGNDQDWLEGGSGNDILIGGDGNSANLSLSVRHTEWRDNGWDHLRGGEGHDSFYIYGAEPQTGAFSNTPVTAPIDLIYLEDHDFTAYFQFSVENTFASFYATASSLSAAMLSSGGDVLGTFVTMVGGDELQGQVHMSEKQGIELIWASWNDGTFAVLAGVRPDEMLG